MHTIRMLDISRHKQLAMDTYKYIHGIQIARYVLPNEQAASQPTCKQFQP